MRIRSKSDNNLSSIIDFNINLDLKDEISPLEYTKIKESKNFINNFKLTNT